MEGLAYLHWAQAYEEQEDKAREQHLEPCLLASNLMLSCFKLSGRATIALLGILCSVWQLGFSSPAQAQTNASDGLYPSSIYAFQEDAPVAYSRRSYAYSYLIPDDSIYAGGESQYAYVSSSSAAGYGDSYYYPCESPNYVPIRPTPSYGNLKFGDSGESVRALQDLLRNAGYFSSPSTGYFGSATENAVFAFQQDYGLIVDGIAGSQTIAALQGFG